MASSVAISAPNAVLGIPWNVWGINSGVTEATDSTCSCTGWTFARGDGVTTEFELPSLVSTMNTIYRRDWQGTVALSASPRTNWLLWSNDFTQWVKLNSGTGLIPVVTPGFAAPPGAPGASCRVQLDIGSGNTSADASIIRTTTACPAGQRRAIWIKSNTGLPQTLTLVYNAGPQKVTATSTWTRVSTLFTPGTSAQQFDLNINGGLGLSASLDVLVYEAQLEQIDEITSQIHTAGAPVTVTDYTLSGSTLTLAEVPEIGADLSVDADLLPHSSLSFGGK